MPPSRDRAHALGLGRLHRDRVYVELLSDREVLPLQEDGSTSRLVRTASALVRTSFEKSGPNITQA